MLIGLTNTLEKYIDPWLKKIKLLLTATIKILFKLSLQLNKKNCFRIPYQRYLKTLNGKNWAIGLVFIDAFVLIKVIAGPNDINPYKQLSVLNELFNEYELENYGFNPFVLNEIISIRVCNDSTFLFKSSRL